MTLYKANETAGPDEESRLNEGYPFNGRKVERMEVATPNSEIDKPSVLPFDNQKRVFIRLCAFLISLTLLVIGRYNVPDNAPDCVVDKAMDWLQGVNDWILGNPYWRDTMQIICSLFMDGMFLSLGVYWIYRGKSSRLMVAVVIFYLSRAAVQSIWFSPYTKGFWWYDPGFPSLVVPYGRGSDFFFSGHIGFVTICASEWHAYGKKVMVYILTVGGIYTGFILLAYQVHYSIDLFVGAIFAHWVFMMVDNHKDTFDNFFAQVYFRSSAFLKELTGQKVMST